jgi:hypothetical protein
LRFALVPKTDSLGTVETIFRRLIPKSIRVKFRLHSRSLIALRGLGLRFHGRPDENHVGGRGLDDVPLTDVPAIGDHLLRFRFQGPLEAIDSRCKLLKLIFNTMISEVLLDQ